MNQNLIKNCISSKICWILTDGSLGMEKQCIGLAESLGLNFIIQRIEVFPFWSYITPKLWVLPFAALKKKLSPPWPDIIITCGRDAIAVTLEIKKRNPNPCYVIKIQDPRVMRDKFDLIITPQHDCLKGPNFIVTEGSLHYITPNVLEEAKEEFKEKFSTFSRPCLGILLGGTNKCYDLNEQAIDNFVEALKAFHETYQGSFLITPSRRTDKKIVESMKEKMQGLPFYMWDYQGQNPYLGILASADIIIPTCDSVNMVVESCATGKPVYVYHYGKASPKFQRFHSFMEEEGYTKPFKGILDPHFQGKRLFEMERVASQVKERLIAFFQNKEEL
jgi:uncharacterized protein